MRYLFKRFWAEETWHEIMCSLKIATSFGEKKIQATPTKQDPGTSWALVKIYVKHPGRGSAPFQSIHKKTVCRVAYGLLTFQSIYAEIKTCCQQFNERQLWSFVYRCSPCLYPLLSPLSSFFLLSIRSIHDQREYVHRLGLNQSLWLYLCPELSTSIV